jgi:Holliday junction resolvase RusA-like endonuclease
MLRGEIRPTCSDATNCQKFYEDCIKDILIEDDRYIAKISSEKIYGEQGKVLINIGSL